MAVAWVSEPPKQVTDSNSSIQWIISLNARKGGLKHSDILQTRHCPSVVPLLWHETLWTDPTSTSQDNRPGKAGGRSRVPEDGGEEIKWNNLKSLWDHLLLAR